MIRSCRYTGRGFNSHRLHHYGGVTDSTGMTMVESRLLGVATARKLQTNNWQRLCITNGCLIGNAGVYGEPVNRIPSIFPRVYMAQANIGKVLAARRHEIRGRHEFCGGKINAIRCSIKSY